MQWCAEMKRPNYFATIHHVRQAEKLRIYRMNGKNEVETGEWNRLVMDAYHSLEFLVTMHYLRKHLPETGKVLDAGGGPGRYAIELCRAGYAVILLDIDP